MCHDTGISANQNSIESFNRVLKTTYLANELGMKLCVFLDRVLDRLMKNLAKDLGSHISLSRIPVGLPARAMLSKAVDLFTPLCQLDNGTRTYVNYLVVNKSDFPLPYGLELKSEHGFVFNRSEHLYQLDLTNSLTKSKVKSYLITTFGKATKEASQDFNTLILVRALLCPISTPYENVLMLQTTHGYHYVRKISESSVLCERYSCDCKGFWHCNECSHVLAAGHLDGCINVNNWMISIPHAKKPGAPRKVLPCK
jgi:hypothetical protein